VETEATDGAFVETSTISRIPLTTSGTEISLPLFPGASWDLERVPLGKRKNPVDYGYPRTLHYQVSVEGLPARVMLPESQHIEGDGWAAETRIRKDGARVEAVWEIRLSRSRFNPENFQELRKLWNAASLLDSDIAQFAP
jgi:hypothetical protein